MSQLQQPIRFSPLLRIPIGHHHYPNQDYAVYVVTKVLSSLYLLIFCMRKYCVSDENQIDNTIIEVCFIG